MSHAILYPVFDFHFQKQLPSFFDTERQLRNLITTQALAILEEVMNEFEITGKVWYIDKLEIDLGEMEVSNLYRDFPYKLRQMFRQKLAQIRFDAQLTPEISQTDTENNTQTNQQVGWEALQMYVEKGEKRWWMLPNDKNMAIGIENTSKTLFLRIFEYVADQNPQELKAFLQKIKDNETAKNRILKHINIEIFSKIALGQKNTFLQKYFLQITQDLESIAGVYAPKQVFEKFFLMEFWAYSLGKNITFTKETLHNFLMSIWQKFTRKSVYFPPLITLPNRLQLLQNPPNISKNTQDFIKQSTQNQDLNIYQEIALFTQYFTKSVQDNWRKYLTFWENQLQKIFNFSKENAQKTMYQMFFGENKNITQTPRTNTHMQTLEYAIFTQKNLQKEDLSVKIENIKLVLQELRKEFNYSDIPTEKDWENRLKNNKKLEKNYTIYQQISEAIDEQKPKENTFKEKELMTLVAELYPSFAPDLVLFLRDLFSKSAWFNVATQAFKRFVWRVISDYFLQNRYNTPDLLELIYEILDKAKAKFRAEEHNFANFWQRNNIITQYNTEKIQWQEISAQKELKQTLKKSFSGETPSQEMITQNPTFWIENLAQIEKVLSFADVGLIKGFLQSILGNDLYRNLQKLMKNVYNFVQNTNENKVSLTASMFETQFLKNFSESIFERKDFLQNGQKNTLLNTWATFFQENKGQFLINFFANVSINISQQQEVSNLWKKMQEKFVFFQLPADIFKNKPKLSNTKENEFFAWIDTFSKIFANNFKGISNNVGVWKEILHKNLLEFLVLQKNKKIEISDFALYLATKWIKTYQITPEYLQETFVAYPEWQIAMKKNRQNLMLAVQSLRYFLETGGLLWTIIWQNGSQAFFETEKLWLLLMQTQPQTFRAVVEEFRFTYFVSVPSQILNKVKHQELKARMLQFLGYDITQNQKLSKKQARKQQIKAKERAELADFQEIDEEIQELEEQNDIFPLKKSTLQQVIREFEQDLFRYFEKENSNVETTQKQLDWIEKWGSLLADKTENSSKQHWQEAENIFPDVFQNKINPLWFSLDISKEFLITLAKKLKTITENQLFLLKNQYVLQTKNLRFDIAGILPDKLNTKIRRNIQKIYQEYQAKNVDFDFLTQKKSQITQLLIGLGVEKQVLRQYSESFFEELEQLQDFYPEGLQKEQRNLFFIEFEQKLEVFYKNYLSVLEGIYAEIQKTETFFAQNPQVFEKAKATYNKNGLIKDIFAHWKKNLSPKAEITQLFESYTQKKDNFFGISLKSAKQQAHVWVENLLHFEKYNDFYLKIQGDKGDFLTFREFMQEFYKNFPEILTFQWQNINEKLKNQLKNELPILHKILLEETRSFASEIQNISQQINENTYQGRGNKVETPKESDKKILAKIAEIAQKVEKKQAQRKDEPLYVQNAGLVILHPYLNRLFGMLGWVNGGKFVDNEAQTKAVLALEFMANKKYEGVEEGDLLLNKILVGMPFKDALLPDVMLTEKELDMCESLLKGVLQNWKSMAESTIDNFRVSFLRREGRLIDNFGTWTLRVEQKTWDMLMGSLPWSIVIVKLPFMRGILNVEWG